MQCIGWTYPEHKTKDGNSGRRSHMQSSCTVLCQQIASFKLFLKEEIEYSAESYIEKQLSIAAAAVVDLCWCDWSHEGGGEGEPVWDKRRQRLHNRLSN